MPAAAEDSNRWHGVVVGVGEGCEEVGWGDVVEGSRWKSKYWLRGPAWALLGIAGAVALEYRSPDRTRRYAARGESLAFLELEDVQWRAARWETLLGLPGAPPADIEPIGRRVLIRMEARPGESGGIALLNWERVRATRGEVLQVGGDVRGVVPGDTALLGRASGTYCDYQGARCVVVHEEQIEGVERD